MTRVARQLVKEPETNLTARDLPTPTSCHKQQIIIIITIIVLQKNNHLKPMMLYSSRNLTYLG